MLAGDMKLKTFLTIGGCGLLTVGALAGGVVVLAGGGLLATREVAPSTPVIVALPTPVASPTPVARPAPMALPDPASAPTAAAVTGREVDVVALGYEGKNIGTDKLKDVTTGRAFKVNVYQDAGESTVNRLKIDLDRDDKWDEKITFKPDEISRDVAPADDEKYTEHYVWNGTWVPRP